MGIAMALLKQKQGGCDVYAGGSVCAVGRIYERPVTISRLNMTAPGITYTTGKLNSMNCR